MMVALLSLGLVQAVWADNVPDFKETLQAAGQGYAKAQFNLGLVLQWARSSSGLYAGSALVSQGCRARKCQCPI